MKRLLAVTALSISLVAFADTKGACKFSDTAKLKDHVTTHIKYPATGKSVKEACRKETPDEFTKAERACLEAKIKETDEYRTPNDVLRALGLQQPTPD